MDISKEYILMCNKATEIQSLWKPNDGDFYLHQYRGTIKGDYQEIDAVGQCFLKEQALVWLPRQDQLQEIHSTDLFTLLHDFDWFIEQGDKVSMQCRSMEQLWLAFVMKEKYNKEWTGKDWRREG